MGAAVGVHHPYDTDRVDGNRHFTLPTGENLLVTYVQTSSYTGSAKSRLPSNESSSRLKPYIN